MKLQIERKERGAPSMLERVAQGKIYPIPIIALLD